MCLSVDLSIYCSVFLILRTAHYISTLSLCKSMFNQCLPRDQFYQCVPRDTPSMALVLAARLSSGKMLSFFCLSSDQYTKTNIYPEQKWQPELTTAVYHSHSSALVFSLEGQDSWIPEIQWKLQLEALACRHLLSMSSLLDKQYSYSTTVFSNPWLPGPICLQGSVSNLNSCSMNIHAL